MAITKSSAGHSTGSTNVAELLERILDKGVVIAGDVKVQLLDIELLTIQLRLVVCSIDKAKEMGLDWWANRPVFDTTPRAGEVEGKSSSALPAGDSGSASSADMDALRRRIAELEEQVAASSAPVGSPERPRRL